MVKTKNKAYCAIFQTKVTSKGFDTDKVSELKVMVDDSKYVSRYFDFERIAPLSTMR